MNTLLEVFELAFEWVRREPSEADPHELGNNKRDKAFAKR